MAWDFLYKPFSQGGLNPGGLSILLPRGGNYSGVSLVGPNGNVINDLKRSTFGDEHGIKFYSTQPGTAFGQNFSVRVNTPDGQYKDFAIGNSGQRYEGNYGTGELSAAADTSGMGGGSPAGGYPLIFTPGMSPGGFGAIPAFLGGMFPSPVFANFNPIRPADFNFTDPFEFGTKYGEHNRTEMRRNFDVSRDLALKTLDIELEGLSNFLPAASALKRQQLTADNQFNQAQRTAQIDSALPGAREAMAAQTARAETFARGRVPDDITDRALELGIRSDAADAATFGGFGARSSVAKKSSDLMSAKERIALSQYGDQLLTSSIGNRANLLLAPTQYSDAGAQVRVMPEVGAGRMTAQYQQQVDANTLINPATALSSNINQEQFRTNLVQGTRQFNASNNFAESQFNAGAANNFGLAKFGYLNSYANAVAGAHQADINTQLALDQQAQAQGIFQDHMGQAQASGQAGAIAQGAAATLPQIAGIIDSVGSVVSSIAGQSAPPVAPSAVDDSGGFAIPDFSVGGGSAPSGPGSSPVVPVSGSAVPDIAPDSMVAGNIPSFGNFEADTGVQLTGMNAGTTRALLNQGASVLGGAGISYIPSAGMQSIGADNSGRPVFASRAMMMSSDTGAGAGVVNTLGRILDPLGTFSDEDASALAQIGTVAGDASLLAQLTNAAATGDAEGFITTALGRLNQAGFTDKETQAGVGAAFSAYQVYQNWDRMSPAQKSLALAHLGIQGYKFADGTNLADKAIIPSSAGNPGLNVGQALGLFQAGINVYSLTKNWDQLNSVQKIAAGTNTAASIANIAQQFNLLGAGTTGAAVPGITAQGLAQAGWQAAPQMGVGAIAAEAGAQIPNGYTLVSAANGGQVAVPTSLAQSAEGAVSQTAGSLIGTAAGAAGFAMGAQQVYKGWGTGGKEGALNGALGGSAMAAGLYAMQLGNPYVAAALIATSVIGNMVKTGKGADQIARDSVRGAFKKLGAFGDDYAFTLADGSKADIGVDGRGGRHAAKNPEAFGMSRSELSSYDVDFTNDLDYAASMGGTALARLVGGGAGKAIDQFGGQIGNAALKNIGFGQDMTPENYDKAMSNMRAFYAQSGVKSKADAFQLANQAFAEGRITETDLVSMHQAFNMIFDPNSYGMAQKLMGGRNRGVEVALEEKNQAPAKTPEKVDYGNAQSPALPGGAKPASTSPFGASMQGAMGDLMYRFPPGTKLPDIAPVLSQIVGRGGKDLSKEAIRELNRRRYNPGQQIPMAG